jgi:hypothetical protein
MPSTVMVTMGPEHGEVARCCACLGRGTLQGSGNGGSETQLSRGTETGVVLRYQHALRRAVAHQLLACSYKGQRDVCSQVRTYRTLTACM